MYLFIDTTEKESFEIALLDEARVVKKKRIKSIRRHSEKLLKSIQALLKSARASIQDVRGIITVKGPGSFTSLRIGIATANALAFGLGISVIGVDKTYDLDMLASSANDLFKKFEKSGIVVPKYGREPDIT